MNVEDSSMQVCAERRTNPASTDRGTTRDNVGNLTTMHLFLAQTIAALRMALLCSTAIGLTLLLATSARAQQQLGPDLPFQWYEDHTAAADLDAFLKLPPEALTWAERPVSLGYTRSALWIKTFIPSTRLATTGNWLSVGPAFIDDITLYVRPHGTEGDWQRKDSGDLWPGSRSELDYRIPTFALPDLEPGSAGLDLIIRAESSSALLIRASVLDDLGLLEHTTRSTGFWSFYFGLAVISLCLAILLAIAINQRFLWAICAFSLTYVLVACIEGFVSWMMAPWLPNLQHYLTSIFSLISFAALLWLWAEALNLALRWPLLYRLTLGCAVLIASLVLLIPLNRYGTAVSLRTGLFAIGTLMLTGGSVLLWFRRKLSGTGLALGLVPLAYVASGVGAQLALSGAIAYYQQLYIVWQYLLILNILVVLALAVKRVRDANRENQSRRLLAHELRTEREASFHQRQFIGLVAHEFRTPLAVISSALQNLQTQGLSETQRDERYEKIQRAAQRLTQLTDNCLADSRLSATHLRIERQPADLIELIRSTLEPVDNSTENTVVVTINGRPVNDWPRPRIMDIDAALIRIALSNLIDNALKYAPESAITVDLAVSPERVTLSVCDHGPGIPPGEATTIFERYRRVERPGRRQPGTGLGLYIAREIARAHGGSLTLRPNQPHGCCFELSVPTPPGL